MPVSTVLRAPQVPLVLLGSQIGRVPMAAAPLALLLFARESVSLSAAGLVIAVFTVAMAAGTPLLARAVDRIDQPAVLYASGAVSVAGYLLAAATPGRIVPLVAGALLAGLGTPPLEACLRALWPDLVPPASVTAAYSLDVALQEVIFVTAPLVTVAAVAAAGPAAGLLVAAVLQVVGVLTFVRAPAVRAWRGVPGDRHWAGPLRVPRLVLLLLAVVAVGAAVGSVPVALAGWAEAAGDRSLTGWMLACQAGGALTGGLLYTRARPGGRNRLTVLTVLFAAGYLPLMLLPTTGTAGMVALQVVSGLLLPPVLTCVFLSADRIALPGTVVEAFAWVATAFTLGSAAGAALTGPLVGAGAGFALAPAAGALAVVAMAAARPPG